MGRAKAFVTVDGIPMASRVAAALREAGCLPVVAIGGDEAALGTLGLEVVADRWPGEGPLGGVITALDHFSEHDAVVVVACDLPRLTGRTVTSLVDALGEDADEVDVSMAVTDQRQSACAAWTSRARAQLSTKFEGGDRRLLDCLSGLRVVEVVVDATELLNVNTPADRPEVPS